MNVYIPILISLAVGIVSSIGIFFFLIQQWRIATSGGIIMSLLTLIPYRVIKYYIDYIMDYCIITPDEIILTEQTGIFQRQIRTLDTKKVKSISVHKKSTFKSIFNNGSIVIMSDGDDNNFGEIQIEYVYRPEHHKSIINHITNSV